MSTAHCKLMKRTVFVIITCVVFISAVYPVWYLVTDSDENRADSEMCSNNETSDGFAEKDGEMILEDQIRGSFEVMMNLMTPAPHRLLMKKKFRFSVQIDGYPQSVHCNQLRQKCSNKDTEIRCHIWLEHRITYRYEIRVCKMNPNGNLKYHTAYQTEKAYGDFTILYYIVYMAIIIAVYLLAFVTLCYEGD